MAPSRRPSIRASFRNGASGLVALRYDEVKEAEPPVLLPPLRNALRARSQTTTVRSPSPSASATSSTARGPVLLATPVVILPPYPVEPPRALHPALRASKRDSILAPTTTTSSLLSSSSSSRSSSNNTNNNNNTNNTNNTITPRNKASARASNDSHTIVVSPTSLPNPSSPPRSASPTSSFPAHHHLTPSSPSTVTTDTTPPTDPTPQAAARPTTPTRSRSLVAPASPASTASPASPSSFASNLTRTFSMRSAGIKHLRKRSVSSSGSSDIDNTLHTSSPVSTPVAFRMRQHAASPEPRESTVNTLNSNLAPAHASVRSLSVSSSTTDCSPSNFVPLSTPIPGNDFWDDFNTLSFSKRGSLMFGAKRAVNRPDVVASLATSVTGRPPDATKEPTSADDMVAPVPPATTELTIGEPPSQESTQIPDLTVEPPTSSPPPPHPPGSSSTKVVLESHPAPDPQTPERRAHQPRNANSQRPHPSTPTTPAESPKPPSVPSIRVLSVEIERESQKVRSLYEPANGLNWQDGGRIITLLGERLEPTEEVPSEEEDNAVASSVPPHPSPAALLRPPSSVFASAASASSVSLPDSRRRHSYAPAGGLEDWDDVDGSEVDRYGFITERRPNTRANTTDTQSARHNTPRQRNVLTKRPGSSYSSSPIGSSVARAPSRKVSARSLNTNTSEFSTASRRSTRSSIRAATNLLPHNRDRRWLDEAGDMLTLQPGLTDIAEDEQSGKIADALRRKELERSEKWRKMAKVIRKGPTQGQGMDFEFDTKNPKLIERTWKGIPDCWRATAWHSFLLTSARAFDDPDTDEHLIDAFQHLQDMASPDDVQIDLDVPRTINRHIMFRRRYRGGQRLLFRVLHAISLYFPETGYVQGMASLAATLLCYYDEEKCFVMMVRMWRYRGLVQLYQPGFAGLMKVLRDLEQIWVVEKDVANKLSELCIDPTAYGTRWYLTLFNLSIPFAAQLRVWDVFMLLGDCTPEPSNSGGGGGSSSGSSNDAPAAAAAADSLRGIDTLHATSAALIHALREVLLDSDFENAMKALTSWVPIKDEELLMKVARARYKQHYSAKRREKAKDKDKDGGLSSRKA